MGFGNTRGNDRFVETETKVAGCQVGQREAEVPAALQDMERQITGLQDEVLMLIKKIGVVMRNAQPVPDSPKNMRSIQSELGNIIAQQAARIEGVSDEVRDARNRLEI